MPSPARRRGSVFGEDGKTEIIDDLVADFAEWGSDTDLAEAVEEFIESNSQMFEGVEIEGEQDLEWKGMPDRFVELIERHLEAFCKTTGAQAEDVFRKLKDVNDNANISQDFVPQIIKMCEYEVSSDGDEDGFGELKMKTMD